MVFPCPILMANGQVQKRWPKKDITSSESEPTVTRIWSKLPGKLPRPAKVLFEGEKNVE